MIETEEKLSDCINVSMALTTNDIFLDEKDLPCHFTISKLTPKGINNDRFRVHYDIKKNEIVIMDCEQYNELTIKIHDSNIIYRSCIGGTWTLIHNNKIEDLDRHQISNIKNFIPIIEKASFMFADFPRQYMTLVENKIDYLEKK
jgi:hypothetical protein